MAYQLPNPLGSKSAGGTFAGYRVDRQGNTVNLIPVDETLNFQEMRARRRHVEPSSVINGNYPAYPGVSVFTTMSIIPDTYLALVRQERPSGDTVLKLVSGYDFDGNKLMGMGASLHHSEDKPDPARKMLDAVPHPYGIYLVGLEGNALTSNIYTMQEGMLVGVRPDGLLLSEAFAPIENGFVDRLNIPLQEYLGMHGRWI